MTELLTKDQQRVKNYCNFETKNSFAIFSVVNIEL